MISNRTQESHGSGKSLISRKTRDQLKREAKDFLEELEYLKENNTTLSKFLEEYRDLFRQFGTSYENVERMEKKKEDLRKDILALCKLIKNDITTGEVEQQNIEILKKETTRRKRQISGLIEESRLLKQEIMNLDGECRSLNKQLSKEIQDKIRNYKYLISDKQTELETRVEKEKESLYEQVHLLRMKDISNHKENERLMKKKDKIKEDYSNLQRKYKQILSNIEIEKKKMDDKKNLFDRVKLLHNEELRMKELMDQENKKNADELQQLTNEVDTKRELLRLKTEEVLRLVERENECKVRRDRLITTNAKKETEKAQLDEQIADLDRQTHTIVRRTSKYETKTISLQESTKELYKRRIELHREKRDMGIQNEDLKGDISIFKKECEKQKTEIEDLGHQENLLQKFMNRRVKEEEKHHCVMTILFTQKRNIVQTLMNYRAKSEHDRKNVYKLNEQKKKFQMMLSDTQQNCTRIEQKKMELDLRKKGLEDCIENEKKELKRQQCLYEEVENDRNGIFKKMSRMEMLTRIQTKKLFILTTTIKQVKDEIRKRDTVATNLELEKDRIKVEIESLNCIRNNLDDNIRSKKNEILKLVKTTSELNEILWDAQESTMKQTREVGLLTNERDLLGNHLLQRNEQLLKFYKEMKINQEKINAGKLSYTQKEEEIDILKDRIECIGEKIVEVKALVEGNKKPLEEEVNRLRKKLVKEKMKLTMLLEESNITMNIHEFRKIQNTYPELFRKIMELQKLKKELVEWNEKNIQIDSHISQKESLYRELRRTLNRVVKIGDVPEYNNNNNNTKTPTSSREVVIYREKTKGIGSIEESESSLKLYEKNLKKKENQIKETKKLLKEIEEEVKAEKHRNKYLKEEFEKLSHKFKRKFFG